MIIKALLIGLTILLLMRLDVMANVLSPIYAAMQTSQAPNLDGTLDDACWQTAEKTAPMTLIGGKEIDIKTRGMLCWDNQNLFIAVICPEPLMPEIEKQIANKSLQPMEDGVEIFIDPDHDHFTHLQLRVDVLGNHESLQDCQPDPDMNTKWSAAVSRSVDGWIVEVAIPLRVAGAVPSSAAVWGLNLNRQRLLDPENRYTCWSDTKGGFQTPSRFGHLVFNDYSTWLRAYYNDKTSSIKAVIAKLSETYPARAASINDQLNSNEQAYKEFLSAMSAETISSSEVYTKLVSMGESCAAAYEKAAYDLRLQIVENEFR